MKKMASQSLKTIVHIGMKKTKKADPIHPERKRGGDRKILKVGGR
jgi:hypothetical protein